MNKVLMLNGPNLNLLGRREPSQYGCLSLDDLSCKLDDYARKSGFVLDWFQSNSEGDLIDCIHRSIEEAYQYIVINPGAYTHTSIGIRDALLAVEVPFIEVHVSNIYARESFRQVSFLSDIAQGVISGLGVLGYRLALDAVMEKLKASSKEKMR